MLNESLKEVMTSNVSKSMAQSLNEITKTIDKLSEASLQKIDDINQIVNGYKKEFEDYKEKMEKKSSYYDKRNNIRDWLFFISVFSMPIYVIIEIYLKFFAK
ncbi:hypothetical protein [Clostridium beijerinckii]|uniref:hypothetical protein n=1 Tax=Clostridium beijerinckii TaxID=1520 RepID=UPI00098C4DEF|nr:hypothetical protein [Clostridium beijerinckii]MBA8937820.1 flagellar hook-associated protein FlgK [Clostridium beijerinckii]NRU41685.1 flagellar hook-associated protein FlgK [Clostridium beijerinckii]OOM64853.1 hypothetical protein CLBEIC_54330 [Clostridium beijerinckii]CUU51204.1 protein of unknown function [Clostridium beijerinckii]